MWTTHRAHIVGDYGDIGGRQGAAVRVPVWIVESVTPVTEVSVLSDMAQMLVPR
jgi:hypothetical protein